MARALRATGTVFIVIGAVILLFVVYELVGTTAVTRAHQAQLREDFDALLAEPIVEPSPSPEPTPTASPAATPRPTPKPRRPRRGVARLTIPRIGVDVIVVDGVRLSDLSYGPGRYTKTAAIGANGTTGIAGHRTGWGAPFFHLDRLRSGDRISIQTAKGTFEYRVTRKTIVAPSDTWVLNGDPRSKADSRLALTTCTPKYTSRDRLIVWADLVKVVPRAADIPAAA